MTRPNHPLELLAPARNADFGIEGVGEKRDPRGREHTHEHNIDAGAGQPGHDGGLEELPAGPAVATDHGRGSVTLERADIPEDMSSGNSQVQRQFRRYVAVGEATYSIGTEESAQRTTACCNEAPCEPS